MTVIANMEVWTRQKGLRAKRTADRDHFRDTTKMVSGGIWWKSRTAREWVQRERVR